MIEKYLTERPNIDGIFATGDILAGMIRGISVKMKKEIEIVGYDGTKTFLNLCPEISTIVQPIEEMANVAVNTLMSMINGEYDGLKEEYVLPVEFVGKRIAC